MSLISTDTSIEPRWKTYSQAAIFSLPALFFGGFGCVILLPKVKTVLMFGGPGSLDPGWLWTNPLFLVEYGRFILVSTLVLLVSLELFSRLWSSYRRIAVGILVWLLNIAIFYGLTLLVLCALLPTSGLAHGK